MGKGRSRQSDAEMANDNSEAGVGGRAARVAIKGGGLRGGQGSGSQRGSRGPAKSHSPSQEAKEGSLPMLLWHGRASKQAT